MNEFRNLYTNETQFLLNAHTNSPSRKILHGFFALWKGMFILAVLGVLSSIFSFFKTHDFTSLFSILALPIAFATLWLFPSYILKSIDAKFEAVKAGRIFIRKTTLVATRLNRERTSSNNRNYKDVYYASVWNEDKSHTYDILTDRYVHTLSPGSPVYIIRYLTKTNIPDSMEEIVVSADFTSNPAYGTIYFD